MAKTNITLAEMEALGYSEQSDGTFKKKPVVKSITNLPKGDNLPQERVPSKSKVKRASTSAYDLPPLNGQRVFPADQLLNFLKNPPNPNTIETKPWPNGEPEYPTQTELRNKTVFGTDRVISTDMVQAQKANKKVKNATKVEIDGIKFDSKLEAFLYGLLKRHKIEFELRKVYTVQDAFKYKGETVRDVRIIPDFYLPLHNAIIDTKASQTAKSKLQFKLLKWGLLTRFVNGKVQTWIPPDIYLPSTKSECEALINKLISEKGQIVINI